MEKSMDYEMEKMHLSVCRMRCRVCCLGFRECVDLRTSVTPYPQSRTLLPSCNLAGPNLRGFGVAKALFLVLGSGV